MLRSLVDEVVRRRLWPIPLVGFVVYPYLKRFTWLSHIWLGLVDGLAPVGAWVAITGRLPWEAWALGAFQIRSVVANAHDGSIPPNHYDAPDGHVLTSPLTDDTYKRVASSSSSAKRCIGISLRACSVH